ncbi:ABC transporter [Hydrogenovibrio sp. SC-1]|uniref:MlaA family lipoprotein n=1 Tax=Hydrogenovibrio sp. SC-1 TaxID=2065820 RepID=UPI000C7D52B6|nr:VacJ family lipoprotein [Hydrogenovibrio sp. SC-1]PLA75332.1 ABC transporter [Hydrogenovibrio sp. SC-1]
MKLKAYILFLYLCVPVFVQGASTPANNPDPYESFNRAMFQFNLHFHNVIGEPVVKAYKAVVPSPARTGVSNFFNNLNEPLNVINALLQGNIESGLNSFMRFTLNSTFGLLGLIDIATPAGLPYQKEDLGQTLAVWGLWSESNYLMLPLVGPYTTRDLFGRVVDSSYNPSYKNIIQTDAYGQIYLFLGESFDDYTKVEMLLTEVKQQPDPYIFMRESYLQYRTNLIYNGNPPAPDLDDFNFE